MKKATIEVALFSLVFGSYIIFIAPIYKPSGWIEYIGLGLFSGLTAKSISILSGKLEKLSRKNKE